MCSFSQTVFVLLSLLSDVTACPLMNAMPFFTPTAQGRDTYVLCTRTYATEHTTVRTCGRKTKWKPTFFACLVLRELSPREEELSFSDMKNTTEFDQVSRVH